MNKLLKVVLPIFVIGIGAAIGLAMIWSRAEPEKRRVEPLVPLVRVHHVVLQDVRLKVNSQGTVSPRTESVLVPEVSGRIIEVSPSFASGGFFEAGGLLLRVDPHDYRQALVQARSAVAQAELRRALELAEAEVAREEWTELGEGSATPLTLREPQLAEAEAALAAAHAAAEQARRNLERTEIRAPYAGRVREKLVDLGQFVARGAPLATIYAVDYAEIRLPLPDSDLAFVELPLGYRGEQDDASGPEVVLQANFAGRVHEWRGRIVRTEGVIDPKSRYVHTVARVRDPYGRGDDPDRPPLAVGMFVKAEILGRSVEDAAVLPRAALRGDGRVLVVDADERLRFRAVGILRSTRDEVIVSSGLNDGDRVCLSTLAAVTDGMRVRIVEDDGKASGKTGA